MHVLVNTTNTANKYCLMRSDIGQTFYEAFKKKEKRKQKQRERESILVTPCLFIFPLLSLSDTFTLTSQK